MEPRWRGGKSTPLPDSIGEYAAAGEDLRSHIQRIFEANGSAILGKLYFMDLNDLQRRYNNQWRRVSKTVHPIVEKVIGEHLDNADYFARLHDAYFLVFASRSKMEAEHCCALIKREIERRLFGEQRAGAPKLRMKSAVIRIDGSVALENVPPLEVLDRMLERAAQRTLLPPGLDFIYRPMWNVRRQVVSSYVCLPTCQSVDGKTLIGDSVLVDRTDRLGLAQLDQATLEHTRDELAALLQTGNRAFLTFPVHFSTLDESAASRTYQDILGQTPSQHRRLMVAELVGLRPEHDADKVSGMVATLRAHCRAVIARFPIGETSFANISASGIVGVGADLSQTVGPEGEIIFSMTRFAELAKKAGFWVYIHGLPSQSLSSAAIRAGFQHLDGEPVPSIANRGDEAEKIENIDLMIKALGS